MEVVPNPMAEEVVKTLQRTLRKIVDAGDDACMEHAEAVSAAAREAHTARMEASAATEELKEHKGELAEVEEALEEKAADAAVSVSAVEVALG